MGKDKVIRKYRRQFLNEGEGLAAICTSVAFSRGTYTHPKTKKVKEYTDLSASVTISDCSRQISLEFSPYKKRDVDKTSRKIDRLILALVQFKKDWEEQAGKVEDIEE